MEQAPFQVLDLLGWIEQGTVVPVVGRHLLNVGTAEQHVHLDQRLAGWLAEELGAAHEPGDTVNEVATRYLADESRRPDRALLYSRLSHVLKAKRSEIPMPPSLLDLAGVKGFDLYLTTCFDPLLGEALQEVRGGSVKIRAHGVLTASEDLDDRVPDAANPTVYHLLGKASRIPNYAVTDEDTLEFLHRLTQDTRPKKLFDRLKGSCFLMLGCDLPDWLTRILVRILRDRRLIEPPGPFSSDYLVDEEKGVDAAQVLFLSQHYVRVFENRTPEAFVRELLEAWRAEHPEEEPVAAAPAAAPSRRSGRGGLVFVSYASEDRAAVEALVQELEQRSVNVWFDRRSLSFGSEWMEMIKESMAKAAICIPVISRNTERSNQEGKLRFFNYEWKKAQENNMMAGHTTNYLWPVIIDDTPQDSTHIPPAFRRHHVPHLGVEEEKEKFLREICDELDRRGEG